jgi:hypothetical protein
MMKARRAALVQGGVRLSGKDRAQTDISSDFAVLKRRSLR